MSKVEPNRNVYVGHRYVPKIFGEWDKKNEYEGLSIVTHQGASYTSKKRVPVGIEILNEEFWVVTGNYNAQIEHYRQETQRVSEDLQQTKIDVNKRIDDTVQYVDTNVNDLTLYVNNEVKENKDYVDNEVEQMHIEMNSKVSKGELVVNVKDYGAVFDGVTDDTQSIKNAVNSLPVKGGVIYLPAGDTLVSSQIPLKSNVTIQGAGKGLTRIRMIDDNIDFNYTFITHGTSENRASNVTLKDFTLDPIDPVPTTSTMRFYNVMRFNNVDNINIERVESTQGHGFITMSQCENFVIRDVEGYDNTDSVITLFNGTKNGVIDNVIGKNISEIIDFFNNDNITCTNLYGETTNSDNEALDMSSSRNITIRDSHFKGFDIVALFKIEESIPFSDYTFDNVIFEDFTGYGINVNLSSVPEQEKTFGQKVRVMNCKFISDKDLSPISYNTTRRIENFEFINNDIDCVNGIVFTGYHLNTKFNNNKVLSKESEPLKISAISNFIPVNIIVDNNLLITKGVNKNGLTVDRVKNITIKNNEVRATGVGIFVKDGMNAIIDSNFKIISGSHGILKRFTLSKFIGNNKRNLSININNNDIQSYGNTTSYVSGVSIDLNFGDDVLGIVNGIKMTGNTTKIDDNNTNNCYGIYFNMVGVDDIANYIIKDNMTEYNNIHIFGANTTLRDNIVNDNILVEV